jgi:uncharacterized repeat protein (TIGR01451 family)
VALPQVIVTASNPVPLYVGQAFNISGTAYYSSPYYPLSGGNVNIALLGSNYTGYTVAGGGYSLAIDPFASAGIYTAKVTVTDTSVTGTNFLVITVQNLEADLSVAKQDAPDPATAGSLMTYTITVTNTGPHAAESVVVVDTLPAGVNPSGGFTNVLGALAAGASTSFALVVTVETGTLGLITNVASVNAATADPNPGNNTAAEATTVNAEADLDVRKETFTNRFAGESLHYVVSVSNNGPSQARNIIVTDILPDMVAFAGTNVIPIGNLHAGFQHQFVVGSGPIHPSFTGVITNRISVAADTPDPNLSNNSNSFETVVTAGSDLAVYKSGAPDPVNSGGALIYSITVTNAGPSDAPDVQVTDILPPDVVPGGLVETNLGALAAGSSVTFDLAVAVQPGASGELTNRVEVASSATDTNPSNNTAWTTTAVVSVQANLALFKIGAPNPAAIGSPLTYTLTVTNHGPFGATSVTVTDALPIDVAFVSANSSQGGCVEQNRIVSCALGAIPAGGSATVSVEVTPTNLPAPLLYAVGEHTTIYDDSSLLFTLNPENGEVLSSVTLHTATQQVRAGWGLAAHPITGELWALLDAPGYAVPDRFLVTINPLTGFATLIGYPGLFLADLAFDSRGNLYGITDADGPQLGTLYLLNQTNAAATPVVTLNDYAANDSLAFNPLDGLLYHRSEGEVNFESVNLQTLTVTPIPLCEDCDDSAFHSAMTHQRGNEFLSSDEDANWYTLFTDGNETNLAQSFFYYDGLAFAVKRHLRNQATVTAMEPDPVPGDNTAFDLIELPSADRDRDGLADAWEQEHFGLPTAGIPLDDEDGDGLTTLDEFISGTNPDSTNDYFKVETISIHSPAVIMFDSVSGRVYSLYSSTNLLEDAWLPVGTNEPGDGNPVSITDTNEGDIRHYRIGVQLAP